MDLIEITRTINTVIDHLDCGSESLENIISTSPEMMDEVRNSEVNGFDEIERGTQKLNELQSKINEITHKKMYFDVENKELIGEDILFADYEVSETYNRGGSFEDYIDVLTKKHLLYEVESMNLCF